MTRDEILNMPAGREMDALVFEFVFGAKWHNRNGRNFLLMPQDVVGWSGEPGRVESKKPDYIGGFGWSTDIAAAWEVVEKFREPDESEPDYWTIVDAGDRWIVVSNWAHHDGDIENFRVEAETAPLAICRAALLASIGRYEEAG